MPIITSTPVSPVKTPIKILLVGPPGSRKTTLMLQFPDIYVEDCDRNLTGPDSWLRKHGLPQLTYAYNPVRYNESGTMREIEDCYDALCGDLTQMAKNPKDYEKFKTVATDSLSHVNEFIIRHVLRMQNKAKKVHEMEARDWSPFKSYAYIFLVARLEQINKNVICTCHEAKLYETDKADLMKKTIIGYEPWFQGSVGDIIGGFFTDVWRLDLQPAPAGKVKWTLYTQRHPKCEHLKNSLDMPSEIDLPEKDAYKVLEPYLKAKGYYVP